MEWYWWVLIWAVVVILSAGVFGLLGLSLWRKAKALATELQTVSDRLAAVSDELQDLAAEKNDPAVFTAPSQLRQERYLNARQRDGKRSAGAGTEPGPRSTRSSGERVR